MDPRLRKYCDFLCATQKNREVGGDWLGVPGHSAARAPLAMAPRWGRQGRVQNYFLANNRGWRAGWRAGEPVAKNLCWARPATARGRRTPGARARPQRERHFSQSEPGAAVPRTVPRPMRKTELKNTTMCVRGTSKSTSGSKNTWYFRCRKL